ncbi:MAG: hypothetical protein ACRED9_07145 [Caulobacteraceae bacterium]
MRRALLFALLASACLAGGRAAAKVERCWVENGAIVVSAAFGSIAGDFILDASEPASLLHATAAEEAGFTGAEVARPLKFPGLRLPSAVMKIENLDARERGFPTNIAGVIGADVLDRVEATVRFRPCRISFSRAGGRRGPFAKALNVRWIADAPAVPATIADRSGRALEGWFWIDTASLGSRIADAGFSRPLPARADPDSRTEPPARLRAVAMAGELIEESPAGRLDGETPGLAGALGLSVWTRFSGIRLELGRGRIELLRLPHAAAPGRIFKGDVASRSSLDEPAR